MEKARCNTELYSNLRAPLNNVKPSNFWGSHQNDSAFLLMDYPFLLHVISCNLCNDRSNVSIVSCLKEGLCSLSLYIETYR